jgi:hypothetical protein
MTTNYNRPDRFRLRRVNARVVKALDELHRARGELYPAKFEAFRDGLTEAIEALARVKIATDVPADPPEQTERLPLGDDIQEAAE